MRIFLNNVFKVLMVISFWIYKFFDSGLQWSKWIKKKIATMFKKIVNEEKQSQLECDIQVVNKQLIQ